MTLGVPLGGKPEMPLSLMRNGSATLAADEMAVTVAGTSRSASSPMNFSVRCAFSGATQRTPATAFFRVSSAAARLLLQA